jgi:hypothetical protein
MAKLNEGNDHRVLLPAEIDMIFFFKLKKQFKQHLLGVPQNSALDFYLACKTNTSSIWTVVVGGCAMQL